MRTSLSGMAAALAVILGAVMLASCIDSDDRRPATGTSVTGIAGAGTPERTARPVRVADPSNTGPGEFNAAAAEQLQTYRELPILWFGKSFENLELVAFLPDVTTLPFGLPWAEGRTQANTAGLVYGACEPQTVTSEMSCPPPLSIVVQGPGVAPPIDQMELHADWFTPYKVRGVRAIDAGTGTILFFENGVTIAVHSDSDIRQKAIQALRFANGEALGLKDIGPGEDLSPLNTVAVPEVD